MKRHATYIDIKTAMASIADKSDNEFGKWLAKFHEAIDILLELSYLEHNLPDIAQNDAYYFFVIESYSQTPLSLTSANLLIERGLYHDSLILLRSIIENLVKCKYFNRHKEQLTSYEQTGKNKNGNKIRINDMWTEVVGENAYKTIYTFLSKFAHKAACTSQPHVNMTIKNESTIQLIPVFNEQFAAVSINFMMYLIYGYLHLAPSFIPYNFAAANNDNLMAHRTTTAVFYQLIKNHRIQFPQKEEWCSMMEKIVEYKSF